MKDYVIRATGGNGQVRAFVAKTTDLVEEARKLHETTKVATAALGRTLTATSMMGLMMKNKGDKLTVIIKGGGPIGTILATADAKGTVKGYVDNPNVEVENYPNGKLNVAAAVGTNGVVKVIKDLGLKDPYVGQVPIYTGEIAEDFAYYFTVSEQTPSAVSLGVLVDKDLSIKCSGGFIIQMMPDADELLADVITYRLEEMPPITTLLDQGKDIKEILEMIFEDMDINFLEEIEPSYKCDCSEERVEKALISIGAKELEDIYKDGKSEEIKCHFCGKAYIFTNEKIGDLLEKAKNK